MRFPRNGILAYCYGIVGNCSGLEAMRNKPQIKFSLTHSLLLGVPTSFACVPCFLCFKQHILNFSFQKWDNCIHVRMKSSSNSCKSRAPSTDNCMQLHRSLHRNYYFWVSNFWVGFEYNKFQAQESRVSRHVWSKFKSYTPRDSQIKNWRSERVWFTGECKKQFKIMLRMI